MIPEARQKELVEYASTSEPMTDAELRQHIIDKRARKGLPFPTEGELTRQVLASNRGGCSMFKIVDPTYPETVGERIVWAEKQAEKGPQNKEEFEFVQAVKRLQERHKMNALSMKVADKAAIAEEAARKVIREMDGKTTVSPEAKGRMEAQKHWDEYGIVGSLCRRRTLSEDFLDLLQAEGNHDLHRQFVQEKEEHERLILACDPASVGNASDRRALRRVQEEIRSRQGAPAPDMLTIVEAAEYANVDERTIRTWLRSADLGGADMLPGAIKAGRKIRIPRASLDPWKKSEKRTRKPAVRKQTKSRKKPVKRKK